jgi:dihydropteroate synthase
MFKKTINIKGKLVNLSQPVVMGIVNVTPDSFFNDSRASNIDIALRNTEKHLEQGATFIDLGAYSTRPGAKDIAIDEELQRILPVVEAISKNLPEAILSIDTFRAKVAEECILAGAHLINDIASGDLDEAMFATIARLQVPYIIMHMQGNPQNMQVNPTYTNVTLEVIDYLALKIEKLRTLGVHDVIIDPGFGFGKTIAHNYQLLNRMEALNIFELPILVGFSRKGMIYKTLGTNANEALNGTTVLNTLALQKGAGILRVHDVKEAVECVKLYNMMIEA